MLGDKKKMQELYKCLIDVLKDKIVEDALKTYVIPKMTEEINRIISGIGEL